MGGGDGAKERRRLKRLQKEGGAGAAAAVAAEREGRYQDRNFSPKNNINNKNTSFSSHKNNHKHNPATRSFDGKWKKESSVHKKSNPSNNIANKKTKKKSMKPKHLKRKLEQADGADADTRKVVLSEIADWERKKNLYLGGTVTTSTNNNNNSNKRPKVETPTAKRPVVSEPEESPLVVVRPEIHFPRGPVVAKPKPNKTTTTTKNANKNPKADKKRKSIPEDNKVAKTTISDSDEPSSKQKNNRRQVESDDSDDSSNESVEVAPTKTSPKKVKKNDSDDSDSDSDDDEMSDGSDGSDEMETEQRRQRGRRRRGRKDTAKQIEESKEKSSDDDDDEKTAKDTTKSSDIDASAEATSEKTRYCLGRKPVTDFVIGQKYSARVVYVKPFGVFFDIGCHSDAFCHVSRLKDDFVENPEELFKEGDQTEARVVEINRREKRITVSLQSESRLEDEMASIEARKKRMEIRKSKYNNKRPKRESSEDDKPKLPPTVEEEGDSHWSSKSREAPKEEKAKAPPQQPSKSQFVPSNNSGQSAEKARSIPKDESEMTPAELKRARKIARRAARRAQSEAS